jgi:hypothetical protein
MADLRVGTAELQTEHLFCEVSVKRLLLEMALTGLRIEPGTRYAEPLRTNAIVTKTAIVEEKVTKLHAGGSLALKADTEKMTGSLAASADASGSLQSSTQAKSESQAEKSVLRVKALGGTVGP